MWWLRNVKCSSGAVLRGIVIGYVVRCCVFRGCKGGLCGAAPPASVWGGTFAEPHIYLHSYRRIFSQTVFPCKVFSMVSPLCMVDRVYFC